MWKISRDLVTVYELQVTGYACQILKNINLFWLMNEYMLLTISGDKRLPSRLSNSCFEYDLIYG
jgi:hypothetical protein